MRTYSMNKFSLMAILFYLLISGLSHNCQSQADPEKTNVWNYSVFNNFDEMIEATDVNYLEPVRISPVGTKEKPLYHGFFYYNHTPSECLQFEPSGRYLLGMRIFIEGRKVQPFDRGEVGYFDLQNNNKWTKIGETTAWNWQQGCRLQWVPPKFEEIAWNERAEDGKSVFSRFYNLHTKKTRTLPQPIYIFSPDGKKALFVNYERIQHRGCMYVGIVDPNKDKWAPEQIGVWEMDVKTGELRLVISLKEMSDFMFPDGIPVDTTKYKLYFFRAGFNPSGTRIFAFAKYYTHDWGKLQVITEGYTFDLDGNDIKYFYKEPSHHYWLNDKEAVDNGYHVGPDGMESLGYFRFVDNGTGRAKEKYFDAPNGHITVHKNGEWILTDTYNMHGYIFLYMFHIPTRKLVPLAKLETQLGGYKFPYHAGLIRVDLHPRFSHDGKSISFDSTHDGFGRQIYMMDISSIIDNPPQN